MEILSSSVSIPSPRHTFAILWRAACSFGDGSLCLLVQKVCLAVAVLVEREEKA
jgi:hypothetical protein